jgi:hypothetical protein
MANHSFILRSPIPTGGFGRKLTSTERRDLRSSGVAAKLGGIVIRSSSDAEWRGYVYNPAKGGGYSSLNATVRMIPGASGWKFRAVA